MKTCRLTLVTITKNDRAGLERTLASAAALRTAGAEQVVIDGSDDPAIARELIAQHDGEIALHAQPPRGIGDAFNAGLAQARGDWVWFLNGGDAVHEELDVGWLWSSLAATRAHVITGAIHYDGENEPRCPPPLSGQWPLLACWLAHPSTILRRERLLKAGGFENRLSVAMDYELWHRLLRGSTLVDVVAIPLARFDVNGVSRRPETLPVVRREEAEVLLRHGAALLREGRRLGGGIARRLLWAVYHWRGRASGRKHADR